MRTIHKYSIERAGMFARKLPLDSKFLCLQLQESEPQMWFEVDDNSPRQRRFFYVFGTGHEIPPETAMKYVGTWQEGAFVWHLYEYLMPPSVA